MRRGGGGGFGMRHKEEVSEGENQLVVVAIDADKNSQHALKWAANHLISRGHIFTLLHVRKKITTIPTPSGHHVPLSEVEEEVSLPFLEQLNLQTKELLLPFQCFCSRRGLQCREVILEDNDIAKAVVDYVMHQSVDKIVLGASSRSALFRQPLVRNSRLGQGFETGISGWSSDNGISDRATRANQAEIYLDYSYPSTISCPSPSRNSFDRPTPFNYHQREQADGGYRFSRFSNMRNDYSYNNDIPKGFDANQGGIQYWSRGSGSNGYDAPTSSCQEGGKVSWSTNPVEELEFDVRRLKLEMKQMEMYNNSYKEAVNVKQPVPTRKLDENQRPVGTSFSDDAAGNNVEDMQRLQNLLTASKVAQNKVEIGESKRMTVVTNSLEAEEKRKLSDALLSDLRYRRYSIEDIINATDNFSDDLKIGEGGYGPVFKATLDHTLVAIKILRPDAAQGMKQFQQEVEVLSCIRHPNMVLLMGACPDHGCLVYEYMANGSLEDRLFCKDSTPPLSWQLRFKIAVEIATGLLFLHQTKPEPLVHRDLKPGNILLDHNYVSKIADVGLARLIPPVIADAVTQYKMTAAAGTFCYIDPEYQKSGMLCIKSDIYALGIILLQLITASPPMGLAHNVEEAMDVGRLDEMLDPSVPDWPMEETTKFATLALKCAELRRRDRPDLGKVVLPELNHMRAIAMKASGGTMVLQQGYDRRHQEAVTPSLSVPAIGVESEVLDKQWSG
ncbi:U-box domain-containing protein 35 [Acorus calamus]|uniref:RING-type E3 ubiquitin transferase n=1 Tax=Acorus calamus TaxID=4465 RepID=A0AAV9E7D0_ACOCL|nr:U-box domain-containing protein 35 [Acorus calamus]